MFHIAPEILCHQKTFELELFLGIPVFRHMRGEGTLTFAPRRAQIQAIERPKMPAPRTVISAIAIRPPFRQCRAVP
jgi:hypothetical protein